MFIVTFIITLLIKLETGSKKHMIFMKLHTMLSLPVTVTSHHYSSSIRHKQLLAKYSTFLIMYTFSFIQQTTNWKT